MLSFFESYKKRDFEKAIGQTVNFVQDNHSVSNKGVLRGLHFQTGNFSQAKLVRVVKGSVLDVCVDIRPNSKTYGKHFSIILDAIEHKQLFIPRGFAHGFVVLSPEATFAYKVDNYYSPQCDRGIAFDDKDLNIDWQIDHSKLQLSTKDTKQPNFKDTQDLFEYGVNYYNE